MRISGKALPPRAALLLTLDFTSLVLVTPMLFILPLLPYLQTRSWSHTLSSLGRLMLAGLACQATFYYNELYNLQVVRRKREMFVGVLRSFALVFLALAVTSILFPAVAPVLPRVLCFSLVLACTAVVFRILALPQRRERVLILGNGEGAEEVRRTILTCPEWNLESLRESSSESSLLHFVRTCNPFSVLDRVIVSAPQSFDPRCIEDIVRWKLQGVPIEDSQSFLERSTGRVRIDGLTHVDCLSSAHYTNGRGKRIAKRLLDVMATSVLLLIALPVMVVVGLLILLQQDGPMTYTQQRIGLYGVPFTIYKFRSMSRVTSGQPCWAADETHRITRLGQLLRTYRLDELPQIFNILRGEMSLVGPRPEQPSFCKMLAEQIPFYDHRHSVPPGLTGWAQVRYGYGSSVLEARRKLEYDLFYVKHLSAWLDIAILIETVKVVVVGRGAI